MKNFIQQPRPVPPQVEIPQDFPAIPKEIADRFPEATQDWQRRLNEFWTRANQGIQQAQNQTAQQVNSSVIFNVDSFLIYANGVPTPMFAVDASGVKIGDVLVVDTPGRKMFIGEGVYADDGTPFYIDTLGFFSLGASLTWNPDTDTLTITGIINATSGTIGGFEIGADYIRDVGNTFGLASTVTGGDDVRLWAGATFANRANAPFAVTEAGYITTSGLGIGAAPQPGILLHIRPTINVPGSGLAGGLFSDVGFIAAGNGDNILQLSVGISASVNRNGFTGLIYHNLHVEAPSVSGAGTLATYIGLYIDSATPATSNYAIYADTTAPNYFGGTLLIGNADTNLYRSAADTLKTDDAFIVVGATTLTSLTAIAPTAGQHDLNSAGGGARLQIFGGTHATFPGQAYLDGDTIYLRSAGGTNRAVLSSSGLLVSSLAGVGTRNVVVDAAGVMSAP